MPNSDVLTVWELQTPSGSIYKIIDEGAREMIKELFNFHEYLGVTTSNIYEGATTNPVLINGVEVTATAGDVVTLSSDDPEMDGTEWAYSSTGVWQKFGKLSGLGELAFKNYVTATYTPSGTVSQPTFSGQSMSSTGKFTPQGTVSQPTFSGQSMSSTGKFTPQGTISTVKAFKTQGSMPTFNVQDHRLIIGDGVLPTGEDVVPTFTGTEGDVNVAGTPAGTVSQPTFSGTEGDVSVTGTPAGTVSQPTFTGDTATIQSS